MLPPPTLQKNHFFCKPSFRTSGSLFKTTWVASATRGCAWASHGNSAVGPLCATGYASVFSMESPSCISLAEPVAHRGMLSGRRRVSMPQQLAGRTYQGTHVPRSPGFLFFLCVLGSCVAGCVNGKLMPHVTACGMRTKFENVRSSSMTPPPPSCHQTRHSIEVGRQRLREIIQKGIPCRTAFAGGYSARLALAHRK